MTIEISTTHLLLAIGGNFTIWLVQFAVLKNDMVWMKRRMKSGDARFRDQEEKEHQQDEQLSKHRAELSAIKTICTAHHGTAFPDGGD